MTTVDPWPLSVDDRTALAELVAHPHHPRPFAIGPDNDNAGTLPGITEAVGTGTAYAITVAPDVVALDVDNPEAVPQLDALADELAADGWPVLRVASGREGHRHLWAVIPDETARERCKFRAVTLGLPPFRTAMRPPGTPHRTGLAVAALDDPDLFRAAVVAARVAALPSDTARDPLNWRDLLRTGTFPRGWTGEGTGSSMVWHVCIGAIRTGHNLETVRDWLADEANEGGRSYRERLHLSARRNADYWLTHYVWPSAQRAAAVPLVVPADATEARAHLDTIREAMTAQRWHGVGGATDRAVLAALLARAHARGSLTPTMSYRELAEAAPCSTRTVVTSVKRLQAAGWLLVAEAGRGTTEQAKDHTYRERANATRWRLRLPEHVARTFHTGGTPPAGTPLSGESSREAGRAFLDACRWRGLGLNAPRVLDALAGEPLTTAELAADLGMNLGNLRYRLLPKLAAFGLLVADGNRWTLPEDLDAVLAAAAEALGLTGKADEVAAQHATERAGYLEYRERTRPDRMAKTRRRAVAARRGALPANQRTLWPVEAALGPVEATTGLPRSEPSPEPLPLLSLAPTGPGAGRAL